MNTKQVIVVRKNYPDGKGGLRNIRRGKEISQASHASMSFLVDIVKNNKELTNEQKHWLSNKFTKICLQVDNEDELLAIHKQAIEAGLTSHLIQDSGATEFGEPTYTALAIGPHDVTRIDPITKDLKLY